MLIWTIKIIITLFLLMVVIVMFLSYITEKQTEGNLLSYFKVLPKNFVYCLGLGAFLIYALCKAFVDKRKENKKEKAVSR